MINDKDNLKEIQRTFMIGDKWLYYKFYSGTKTADIILTKLIKPLTEKLLSNKIIDKWFFIRYNDPKSHIRVRFHVKNTDNLSIIIRKINTFFKPYVEQDLIWKIQVDSYQREIERYGIQSMEMSETLFFYESRMIVDLINSIKGDEDEQIRWLFGLKTIDALMTDFSYSMEEKFTLVTRLRENFGKEHNMNRMLKGQMEKIFRKDRKMINNMLDLKQGKDSSMGFLFELIRLKSEVSSPIIKEILRLYNNKTANPFYLNDLISSYSHMLINRLFKTRQRTHELVLYDFLHRYYKSEIARKKYGRINKMTRVKNQNYQNAVTI